MISVVINVYGNKKYLIRCLNSIKRQSYNDIEIIVMSDAQIDKFPEETSVKLSYVKGMSKCEAIKKTLDMVRGEGVLMVTCDSVLTSNTIQELLIASDDLSVCSYTRAYTLDDENYILDKKIQASVYGKLYNKELLKTVVSDANVKYEFDVIVKYFAKCKKLELANDTAVYESNGVNFIDEKFAYNTSDWKKVLNNISEMCVGSEVRNYITAGLGEIISQTVTDTEDIMLYAKEKLHDDVWLNYAIAKRNVEIWWSQLQESKNYRAYKKYIEYISSFEGDTVAKLLLRDCGIDENIFELMKSNEQVVFLEIFGNIKSKEVSTNIACVKNIVSKKEVYSYEMTGTHLADFVVEKYRTGCLGFKTIFKSMIAWIKYKI